MYAVAIDGPAGAGKSTIAKAVAGKLGYIYVDTGALYRAVGLFAAKCGISSSDEEALALALEQAKVELGYTDGVQRVYLDGEDVSDEIRSPEMSKIASIVSALPAVRAFLFDLQQEMARRHNVIMDGRDIGTVVLPNADVKIFLTASADKRAERRHKEYLAKNNDMDYDKILRDIKQRDYDDSHRAIAPLKRAEDAVLLDTSTLNLEESISELMKLLKERGIS